MASLPDVLQRTEQRCGACYQFLAVGDGGKLGCPSCGWGFLWGGSHA